MIIYLCGPINGQSDEACLGWRRRARGIWGWRCVDPMSRDYRGAEDLNVAEIVEGDKADIDKCTHMLVWWSGVASVGTAMEMLYAWERNKTVVVVNEGGHAMSPWMKYHAHRISTSLEAAL